MPPFALDVLRGVAAGRSPSVYAFAGPDARLRAQRRRSAYGADSALVLPPGDPPDAYFWPGVPGGVLVAADGQPRSLAAALARAITACGTPLVVAIFGVGDVLIERRPEWGGAA